MIESSRIRLINALELVEKLPELKDKLLELETKLDIIMENTNA